MTDGVEASAGGGEEASGAGAAATGADCGAGNARVVREGVVDEIARRAFLSGARILGVRSDDIPGNGSVAAILRFAV